MNGATHNKKKRTAPRRLADKHLHDQFEKYSRLIQAGQIITSELNVGELFHVISDQIRKILDVERCSIFLIDETKKNLCSFVSADMGSDQIQFSTHQGIAGWVFCNRAPQVVNDAYADARFYKEVDKKNIFKGFFHTQPTQHYSSKTQYAFNAGGTGTDLLRMQTYAERLGFKIDFSSQRCRFIPDDADACPGSLSLCENITAETDCMVLGGQYFHGQVSQNW